MTNTTVCKEPVNPFTPVFGKVPPYMAGRDQIVAEMLEAFEGGPGDPNLSSIFVGARGTGKTSLLSYFSAEARGRGWVSADVTASPGMLDDILLRLADASSHLVDTPSTRRLTGVELAGHVGLSPNWRSRMNVLLDQLAKTDTGVLITVDEVDPNLDEMVQLVTTYQHFVREDRKVALLMAGLPHRVSGLLSGKSTSFLRRACRHNLGSIPGYEVEDALRITFDRGGKEIDDAALRVASEAIGGFPYMFQLVGYRSWNAAGTRHRVGEKDVQSGVRLARAELKDRVFDVTYLELSRGDRDFLQAMLPDGGSTAQADLPARLGKSSSHVSNYKRRLLEQGVIEEPRRGVLTFALPGFRAYLEEELA